MDTQSVALLDIIRKDGYLVSSTSHPEYGVVILTKNGKHENFRADTIDEAVSAAYAFFIEQVALTSKVVDL